MARPVKSKKIEEEGGIYSQATEQSEIEQSTAEQAAADGNPTDEQIRMRAYEIYLERGGGDGNDADDWLQAERELRGGSEAQEYSE